MKSVLNQKLVTLILFLSCAVGVVEGEIIRKESTSAVNCSPESQTGRLVPELVFSPDSAAVRLPDGTIWELGDRINQELLSRQSLVIVTEEFGVSIGPYYGAIDNGLKIGWNTQNRVLYLETINSQIETVGGLRIGSSRSEVLESLGQPTMKEGDRILYAHNDAELIGMVFVFDNSASVSRIIIFSET